ncbi:DNA helicase II [Marinospirillum alkaliphilum]|uniref:DNA 3'-5' helicase n=1 Tax=Marinospirillum alkaliphilum DSM 21637 TaxID=1122209 RepID=A0A1K1Y4U2_9GAMM|nr:DNA helicase II [Marinospirillum alkaliphilum]SFX56260.1 ATP-dependent DNA helicase UvrD [Marinospirillum alkaliphilum DSM 21637]
MQTSNSHPLLQGLNPAQAEVVAAPSQDLLVLAGAGSGKTRVLVQRIVWLVREQGLSPHEILAVTFTNKAAKEMRLRLETSLNMSLRSMWVGTFHGLSHRLLRTHWKEAGLPEHFQILDSDDQLGLIKRLMKELGVDTDSTPPKQVQAFINGHKDEGRRAAHVLPSGDFERRLLELYQAYEALCQRQGLVDFAELLLRSLELLRDTPALLRHYQQRFSHLLVDEFQDTNNLQYAWLRLLRGSSGCIMAVGDDDQSIYGWRGARIENIQNFTQDLKGAQLLRLEQNYRSTATILDAANALISNNSGRLGKSLWTEGSRGDPIRVYAAFNEQDEARFIVDIILQHVRDGGLRSECAVLYRSNAQSRALEEAFLRQGMPYRVYGGHRFYERMEIKNALAYLKLMVNRQDDAAFERVINTPTRGIGTTTVEKLRAYARDEGLGLWDAAVEMISKRLLTGRAATTVQVFIELVEQLDEQTLPLSLHESVEVMLELTELKDFHAREKGEKGQARVENLKELITAVQQYEPILPLSAENGEEINLEGRQALAVFLTEASLDAGDNQAEEDQDAVQLMTLHTAKGLEFPLVFLAGVEEGLFPHQMALDSSLDGLEEERRLCYVGITRAMKTLYLTYAESRRIYGRENFCRPSRFLNELPTELLHEVRLRAAVSRPMSSPALRPRPAAARIGGAGNPLDRAVSGQQSAAAASLRIGQRVEHKKFGVGIILHAEGEGDRTRLLINFDDAGEKWLVLGFAPLTPLD